MANQFFFNTARGFETFCDELIDVEPRASAALRRYEIAFYDDDAAAEADLLEAFEI